MFRKELYHALSSKLVVTILVMMGCLVFAAASDQTNTLQNVSWFAWITGQSLSFEFHFLDLLELLSRL